MKQIQKKLDEISVTMKTAYELLEKTYALLYASTFDEESARIIDSDDANYLEIEIDNFLRRLKEDF